VALGSTQPQTEISWGGGVKGGRYAGLTIPPSCADCHEIWQVQPRRTFRACPALYRDYFTSFFFFLVTEGDCVFSAVRTEFLYVIQVNFLTLRYGGVVFCCQRQPAMPPSYVTFHAGRLNAHRYAACPFQCDLFSSRISNCFNCMK